MAAVQWSKRAKILLFPLFMLPLLLAILEFRSNPGEIETFLWKTGQWTIRFLIITLLISPLRQILKWNWLITYRRPLGLTTFYYACVHLFGYSFINFGLDTSLILQDMLSSPYIIAGVVAFFLLIPLAITSTKRAIRRLGKYWRLLHRLIYVVGVLGIVHALWHRLLTEYSPVDVIIYLVIIVALLGFRIINFFQKKQAKQ